MIISLCTNQLGLSISGFVKMTLTRLSSHRLWLE